MARAVTEQDGSRAFEFAWNVSRQRAGVVDHLNAPTPPRAAPMPRDGDRLPGRARVRDAEPLTPRNRAVAITDQCTACVVAAEARQFIRVVDQPVKFTDAGKAELADVRRDLRALETQDLPLDQLHQAVERKRPGCATSWWTRSCRRRSRRPKWRCSSKQVCQSTDVG